MIHRQVLKVKSTNNYGLSPEDTPVNYLLPDPGPEIHCTLPLPSVALLERFQLRLSFVSGNLNGPTHWLRYTLHSRIVNSHSLSKITPNLGPHRKSVFS